MDLSALFIPTESSVSKIFYMNNERNDSLWYETFVSTADPNENQHHSLQLYVQAGNLF